MEKKAVNAKNREIIRSTKTIAEIILSINEIMPIIQMCELDS